MSAVGQTTTLAQLATEANQNHRLVDVELKSAVQYAVWSGTALIGAKAQLKHGEWLPWLDANFEGSRTTARSYMRIARAAADDRKEPRAVSFDSIRRALADLMEPKPMADPLTDAPWGSERARTITPPAVREAIDRAAQQIADGSAPLAQRSEPATSATVSQLQAVPDEPSKWLDQALWAAHQLIDDCGEDAVRGAEVARRQGLDPQELRDVASFLLLVAAAMRQEDDRE